MKKLESAKRIFPSGAFMAIVPAVPGLSTTWEVIALKSIIEIFERNGKVYGKIVKIFTKVDPDPICEKCPEDDPRYGKKIIGMEIIRDMKRSGDEYSDGNILDPEAGKVYRCKIWLEGHELKVRGYWGPFYRTQTWKKAS